MQSVNNAPKLGQKNVIDFDLIYKTDQGRILVEQLQSNKYVNFRNYMVLPTIMKHINLIYQDRIKQINENEKFKEIDCANFTYIFLSKLFGLKQIIDQKFIIFILSVKKNMQILRINQFANFIFNQNSLSEFNQYIDIINFTENLCTVAKNIENIEIENKYYIPYLKVVCFIANFSDSRMTNEETIEFQKEIEQLKIVDIRNPNNYLISFDDFFYKTIEKQKMLVNRAKIYVINAFDASDLDGNGVCNLQEFLILNKHIENENYNEEILTQIFKENADKFIDDEQNLSFDKFASVSVDFNLFSDDQQNKFIAIKHKQELNIKFDELKENWSSKKEEIFLNIQSLLDEDDIQKWNEILMILDKRISSKEKQAIKPLLIAVKILEKE
ncbi:hypothetical protein IMG5_082070, partial [Ichthyophthirius multifiliis]